MRWVTKAALACFGLSMLGLVVRSSLEQPYKFLGVILYVFLTLALILALIAILIAPGPERDSYLYSILTGIVAGFIIAYIFFTSWAETFPVSLGSSIERDEVPTLIFVSNVPPILAMVYSLLLSKMHPCAWKEVRVRLTSIVILLLAYPLGSSLLSAFFVGATSIFLVTILWFPPVFSSGILEIKTMFIYSNIVTIIAVYIATIGIKDLRMRTILSFGLILLMNIVASSPLTHAQFFT